MESLFGATHRKASSGEEVFPAIITEKLVFTGIWQYGWVEAVFLNQSVRTWTAGDADFFARSGTADGHQHAREDNNLNVDVGSMVWMRQIADWGPGPTYQFTGSSLPTVGEIIADANYPRLDSPYYLERRGDIRFNPFDGFYAAQQVTPGEVPGQIIMRLYQAQSTVFTEPASWDTYQLQRGVVSENAQIWPGRKRLADGLALGRAGGSTAYSTGCVIQVGATNSGDTGINGNLLWAGDMMGAFINATMAWPGNGLWLPWGAGYMLESSGRFTLTRITDISGGATPVIPKYSIVASHATLPTTVRYDGVSGTMRDGSVVTGGIVTSITSGPGPGAGSVTSVGLSAATLFTVTGSPVTSSGTLGFTWNDAGADALVGWYESANQARYLTLGAGLSMDGTSVAVEIGSEVQGWSADLDALAALTPSLGTLIVGDGTDWVALPVGADGDTLVADSAEPSGLKWAAGGGTGTVTGVALSMPALFGVSGSPITTSGTLTVTWADPGADRIMFWDDSASAAAYLATGTTLAISGTTLDVVIGGASGIQAWGQGLDDINSFYPPDKGSLLVGDGSSWLELGVNTDGYVLTADSVEPTGLKWSPASGGTVTSVGLVCPDSFLYVSGSPITSAGDIGLEFVAQAAALVLAGPATGSPASPAFRALVDTDLPPHTHSAANITSGTLPLARGGTGSSLADPNVDRLLFWDDSAGAVDWLTVGSGLSLTGTTLTATGSGTVTSVALSAPGIFSVSGSPVTSSGTLTVSLVNQNANTVWAGPTTGGAASPTFRALVSADLPTHTHSAADITSGILAPVRGGTGLDGSAAANGNLPIGNGSGFTLNPLTSVAGTVTVDNSAGGINLEVNANSALLTAMLSRSWMGI